MAEQNKPDIFFGELKQKAEAYISDRILLFKLQVIKKISRIITALLVSLIVFFVLVFVILFVSIAVGFYFSHIMHNAFYGFGAVAVFYFLLFFVIIIFRNLLIKKPIVSFIIKILFN